MQLGGGGGTPDGRPHVEADEGQHGRPMRSGQRWPRSFVGHTADGRRRVPADSWACSTRSCRRRRGASVTTPRCWRPTGRRSATLELDRRSDEVAVGPRPTGVGPGRSSPSPCPRPPSTWSPTPAPGQGRGGHGRRQPPADRSRAGHRPSRSSAPDLVLATPPRSTALRVAGGAAGPARAARPTPTGPSPSCSPRARPGCPGAPMFRDRQLAAITRIDVGRPLGRRRAAADAGRHPVRPHRVHDQAALVPAARDDHPPARPLAGRRRARPGRAPGCRRSAGWRRRSRCCSATPDLDARDLSCVQTIIVGGGPSPPALVDEARRRFGAGVLDPLLVHRVRRRRHRHRLRRRRRGGALHRRATRGGIEVEIRDEAGRRCRRRGGRGVPALPRVDGRLLARPGGAPRRRCVDGWLRTGDLGTIDERAASCWPAAPRRCSSAVATTCTRWRWRRLLEHPGVAEVAVVPRRRRDGRDRRRRRRPPPGRRPPTLDDLRTFAGTAWRPTSCPRPFGS